jgi:ribonuclease HI
VKTCTDAAFGLGCDGYRDTKKIVEEAITEISSLKAELKAINAALDDPRTDLTMTACEVIASLKAQHVRDVATLGLWDDAITKLREQLAECKKDADSKQAKIDSLMFEHCPEDMTDAQVEAYCAAQKEEAWEEA